MPNFEDCMIGFRRLLTEAADYPEELVWVKPSEVLLTGGRHCYVRVANSKTNESDVRRMYENSVTTNQPILFETICYDMQNTYAYAWVPRDDAEAGALMMNNGPKLSVKIGAGKTPYTFVKSRFLWKYLRFRLRKQQALKSFIFFENIQEQSGL